MSIVIRRFSVPRTLFAVFLFVMLHVNSAAAIEATVEAFASWQMRGQLIPTGPKEATFTGVLSGILYVRGNDGSFEIRLITCPGTMTINTEDLRASGG